MATTEKANLTAARVNWHGMGCEEPAREIVTLTDPKLPGVELVIEIEQPSPLTNYKAAAVALEMVRRHITGDPARGHEAFPFLVAGSVRETTESFWDDVAMLVAMQPEPNSLGFANYDADDLAQMAFRSTRMWEELWGRAHALKRKGQESLPNDSGPPEES